MKSAVVLAAVAFVFLGAREASARSRGAPTGACRSMKPGHGFDGMPHDTSPFAVTAVKMGNKYMVMVAAKEGMEKEKFEGVMIRAVDADGNYMPGKFTADKRNTKTMSCDSKDDAVTHKNAGMKKMVAVEWMGEGEPTFVATVVQEFDVFWVKLSSKPMA